MSLLVLLLFPHFLEIIYCANITSTGFHSTLGHLKAGASLQVQAQAATGVIERLVPDKAGLFQVTVDPKLGPVGKDTFKVA
jgi:hypothetical protein